MIFPNRHFFTKSSQICLFSSLPLVITLVTRLLWFFQCLKASFEIFTCWHVLTIPISVNRSKLCRWSRWYITKEVSTVLYFILDKIVLFLQRIVSRVLKRNNLWSQLSGFDSFYFWDVVIEYLRILQIIRFYLQDRRILLAISRQNIGLVQRFSRIIFRHRQFIKLTFVDDSLWFQRFFIIQAFWLEWSGWRTEKLLVARNRWRQLALERLRQFMI